MRQAGYSVLLEMPLPDGRRADIFAVGRGGELIIVETKSSIEDWRGGAKRPDYLAWGDQLFLPPPRDFPHAPLPGDVGVSLALASCGGWTPPPPRPPPPP